MPNKTFFFAKQKIATHPVAFFILLSFIFILIAKQNIFLCQTKNCHPPCCSPPPFACSPLCIWHHRTPSALQGSGCSLFPRGTSAPGGRRGWSRAWRRRRVRGGGGSGRGLCNCRSGGHPRKRLEGWTWDTKNGNSLKGWTFDVKKW